MGGASEAPLSCWYDSEAARSAAPIEARSRVFLLERQLKIRAAERDLEREVATACPFEPRLCKTAPRSRLRDEAYAAEVALRLERLRQEYAEEVLPSPRINRLSRRLATRSGSVVERLERLGQERDARLEALRQRARTHDDEGRRLFEPEINTGSRIAPRRRAPPRQRDAESPPPAGMSTTSRLLAERRRLEDVRLLLQELDVGDSICRDDVARLAELYDDWGLKGCLERHVDALTPRGTATPVADFARRTATGENELARTIVAHAAAARARRQAERTRTKHRDAELTFRPKLVSRHRDELASRADKRTERDDATIFGGVRKPPTRYDLMLARSRLAESKRELTRNRTDPECTFRPRRQAKTPPPSTAAPAAAASVPSPPSRDDLLDLECTFRPTLASKTEGWKRKHSFPSERSQRQYETSVRRLRSAWESRHHSPLDLADLDDPPLVRFLLEVHLDEASTRLPVFRGDTPATVSERYQAATPDVGPLSPEKRAKLEALVADHLAHLDLDR